METMRPPSVAFFHHDLSQPQKARSSRYSLRQFTATRLATLFLLAMSGHAGPIQIAFGVTPVVYRISCGQAAALLKGRRAGRTETGGLSNRASDGDCGQPKSRDGRCQPELRRGLRE